MSEPFQVTFTESDHIAARAQLARDAAAQKPADTIGTYREHACVAYVLMMQAEWLTQIRAGVMYGGLDVAHAYNDPSAVLSSMRNIGGNIELAKRCGPETETMYRATLGVCRKMLASSVRVTDVAAPAPLPPGGDEMGFIPAVFAWPLVVGVVGIGAVIGATWWGTDRNEMRVRIEGNHLAARLDQYQRALDDSYRRGGPPLPPPPMIDALAKEEATFMPYIGVGVGAALVAAIGYGVYKSIKAPRSSAARTVSNPSPRRRRLGASSGTPRRRARRRRKNAAKAHPAPAAIKTTAPKKNPRRKTRGKNPRVAKRRRKSAAPKRRAVRKTRRNAAPRKKNPRRSSSGGKAGFIRSQQAKGRSQKQAAAAWKLKNRSRKKGKARAR